MSLRVKIDPRLSLSSIFRALFAGSNDASSKHKNVSQERIIYALDDVEGWLSIKLHSGKCSKLLKEQLAIHTISLGELNAGRRFYFNPYDVFTVIENIENGQQKLEKPFTGCLRGLFHAHHSMACFTAENALRYWNRRVRESGASENEYLEKLATELLKDKMRMGMTQDEATKDLLFSIACKVLMDSVEKIDFKTGEWLIYAKHGGINYYLTLAFHSEGDEKILNKLEICFQEFDFLRNIVVGKHSIKK